MKDLYTRGGWVGCRKPTISGGHNQSTVTTPEPEGIGKGHEREMAA